MTKIAVIGAGIVGLSTAVCVQQTIPGASVTVIADKFGTETTSDGAAGMFRPTLDLVPGVPEEIVRTWIMDSWNHFDNLAKSIESAESGVFFLSGYHLYDTGEAYVRKPDLLEEVVYQHRHISDEEHKMFGCRKREFQKNGGRLLKRTLTSFDELVGSYDVVVNCTGLRAKEILSDEKLLQPNRGQVLRVKAPWIKHFIYVDNECWIIPGQEWVVVGGTREPNNGNTQIVQKDVDDVWKRACEAVPSLKNAEIMKIWPGLRPYRNPLRLEVEQMNFRGWPLKVVHNYGHGGNGIGLSWGTAVQAAKLVHNTLRGNSKL